MLKRSQIARGTSRLKRSPIARGGGIKPRKVSKEPTGEGASERELRDFRSRKPINRIGPRTREWQAVWRFLKPKLEAVGRTTCEFDFIDHDCWGRLDPAHSKKRNKMKGNDIYAVAIACQNAHIYLDEVCTHERMEELVLRAINRHGGMILPVI